MKRFYFIKVFLKNQLYIFIYKYKRAHQAFQTSPSRVFSLRKDVQNPPIPKTSYLTWKAAEAAQLQGQQPGDLQV